MAWAAGTRGLLITCPRRSHRFRTGGRAGRGARGRTDTTGQPSPTGRRLSSSATKRRQPSRGPGRAAAAMRLREGEAGACLQSDPGCRPCRFDRSALIPASSPSAPSAIGLRSSRPASTKSGPSSLEPGSDTPRARAATRVAPIATTLTSKASMMAASRRRVKPAVRTRSTRWPCAMG